MQNLLRAIPKVDELLNHPLLKNTPHTVALDLIRSSLENLRRDISNGKRSEVVLDLIAHEIYSKFSAQNAPSIIPLINATGVVVHTNLGRSVLDRSVVDEIAPLLTSYTNLEFEMDSGKRGSRYTHLADLMRSVVGCEDVLIVNNNAAAVFLILNTFSQKKESVVSRGELVEIGGSFRIPDVMRESGAILHEVGTTNKTHLSDYKNAINENTAILMKVHRSNFAIKGFTSEVDFLDLMELADANGVIDYFDLGSGQLANLGVGSDPLISTLAKKSPSLVSFSGDKLFGGVQAGVIFGKKELIDRLKQNQLLRMLRVDKFTLCALEATLRRYQQDALHQIPTVKMIRSDENELKARAHKLLDLIRSDELTIEKTANFVGGGALPEEQICGVAVVSSRSAELAQKKLRDRGVIARVEASRLYIEIRTVFDSDLEKLATIIKEVVL